MVSLNDGSHMAMTFFNLAISDSVKVRGTFDFFTACFYSERIIHETEIVKRNIETTKYPAYRITCSFKWKKTLNGMRYS